MSLDSKTVLYTIGHSIYPMEAFIEMLRQFEIEVIADVRSNPYSRYATHFTGPFLKKALAEQGLKYVFLGGEIGGKPKEQEFYDEEGYADYSKLAASEKFAAGMERLENGLSKFRVAIMCGEEDPSSCHRHLLIAKVANERGICIKHIRKGGEVQDYEEFLAENSPEELSVQLSLFATSSNTPDEANWKSGVRILKDSISDK